MDPIRLCMALGPLAIYLLVLGILNLGRRPFVTTGARDLAAVGIAVGGLILVGPLELFMPRDVAFRYGQFAWLYWVLLVSLYISGLTLVVLSARPRLSLYNATADTARQLLNQVAAELDPAASWSGDMLSLPTLRVQLLVEPFLALKSVSLSPVGARQSCQGWKRLEIALVRAVKDCRTSPNPAGVSFCVFALLILGAVASRWLGDPQAVARAINEMMGR